MIFGYSLSKRGIRHYYLCRRSQKPKRLFSTEWRDIILYVNLLPSKLQGFNDYEEFLRFSRTLFRLNPEEYFGLFKVLEKLQCIGEDPIKCMLFWRSNASEHDCIVLIQYLIKIDNIDI